MRVRSVGSEGKMNESDLRDRLVRARIDALTEHYQKTYELVLHFWERRNRQFLILVGVLAVAALATIFQHPLLAAAKAYLEEKKIANAELAEALPLAYRVIVTFLLVAAFYLMANLYHRSGVIINYYQYLGLLEQRIRNEFGFGPNDVAFAREGRFYRVTGSRMTRWIGFSYKLVLGSVTLLFFASRIWFDLPSQWPPRVAGPEDVVRWYGWLIGNFFFVIDVVVAIPTLWLFWRYARLSAMRDARVLERFQELHRQASQSSP